MLNGYDERGIESTKFAILSQPQQLLNLHIVGEFPTTTELSRLMKTLSKVVLAFHVFIAVQTVLLFDSQL